MTGKSASCSDEDFITLFKTIGPAAVAKRFNIGERAVHKRRVNLEKNLRLRIDAPDAQRLNPPVEHPHRLHTNIKDGIVLVGSDAHIWPGPQTTAMRAFIKFCKSVDGERPKLIVLNGDVMDFPGISRHPPIGWESLPDVVDEIEAAKDILHEIELAAFKTRKIWTGGNHDFRFETRIATVAPEYAKIHGVHLSDHFPNWEPCWSAWVNSDIVIKHRHKGGIHATHNSTLWAGKTTITGHLHSAKVTGFTDYNGTRYGVDTGCLADPDAAAFRDYTEDNPKNWRSGFCVLTLRDGKLLQPELVLVWGKDTVQFRGKIIKV